jgi:hypothetical protein
MLKGISVRYRIPAWQVFIFFQNFEYISQLSPDLQVSSEISVDNCMRIPLNIIYCFSLAAFKILSVCAGSMAQPVENLLRKCKALSSNPSTDKKNPCEEKPQNG